MGSFAPVFLAFILNCFGCNIFREPKPGCEPLVSCLIFLFSVFILLWDIRLYPTSLRKIWTCGARFLDFLLAMFLMEVIMADFWFPLEAFIVLLLPKIADAEKDLLTQGGWEGEGILQFLRWTSVSVIASYVLSIFFFLAILHATRAVDFRLLRCGLPIFFGDIFLRLKRTKRKLLKILIYRRERVKFREECDDFGSRSKSRQKASENIDDDCMDSDYDVKLGHHHHVSRNDYDCSDNGGYDSYIYEENCKRRHRRY